MNRRDAGWPEQFVYVCSATRAALVNMLPIIHADLHRVRGLVVFCGASGPDSPDGTAQAEAIEPAERLEKVLSSWTNGRLSAANGTVTTLYGDPGDFAAWRGNMGRVFEAFGSPEGTALPILFNIKGGTKEMAIGGILGRTDEERFQIVTVRGEPLQVERVSRSRQAALPVQGRMLGLRQYLAIYGLWEDDGAPGEMRRNGLESFYREQGRAIRAFAAAVLADAPRIAAALNRIAGGCFSGPGGRTFESSNFGIATPLPAAAFVALDGFPGLAIGRDDHGTPVDCTIETEAAANFLRGGWLEALLYLEIADAMRKRNDVEIAASLRIRLRNGANQIAEFDIAVLIRSQLHLIEAKTANMGSAVSAEAGERSFAQLDSMKRLLLGQVGKALIVNPRVTQAYNLDGRARRGGEELFLGRDAVEHAVERIRQLAGAPPV